MTDRPTGILPPARAAEWKSWVALALFFFGPPAAGTGILTVKLDNLQTAVSKNTAASVRNTDAVNKIQLEMQAAKVTDQRLSQAEDSIKDHELRIRALEAR